MEIKSVKISTDGWDQRDIEDIQGIFPKSMTMEQKNLAQFLSGIELAIIFGLFASGKITGGFFDAMGKDAWNGLKTKLVKKSKENKHSSIGFEISNGTKSVKLSLKTKDSSLIERALDTVDNALNQIKEDETNEQFHFDNEQKDWVKIVDRKFYKKIKGIAASTTPVKKGDKVIQLTIEQLHTFASQMINSPITLSHGGKPVGKITKAWVEDDKLMYEGGIYEGLAKAEETQLDEIMKTGGVSIGFKY